MPTGAAPTGAWTIDGAVVVREVPFAADKSAEISKPGGAGTASLAATFAEQRGRVVFEAKVLARETAGFKAIPYIYDAHRQRGRIGRRFTTATSRRTSARDHRDRAAVRREHLVSRARRRRHRSRRVRSVRRRRAQEPRPARCAPATVRSRRSATTSTARTPARCSSTTSRSTTRPRYIGAPPPPVFDPRDYGAVGDGTTNDAAAIQQAIDAAAGTGGSVVLADGTFLSGTLTLQSNMTFFIDASATLLGSTNVADYPDADAEHRQHAAQQLPARAALCAATRRTSRSTAAARSTARATRSPASRPRARC